MLEQKAAKIKLLILDVDGVLTDGKIIIDSKGEEIKYFDVKDGQGLRFLLAAGLEVAIISGRESKAVEYRIKGLGIKEIHQGIKDKKSVLEELIRNRSLTKGEVCCIGDDIPDIIMFGQVGLSIAVSDAVPEVLKAADFVTNHEGGNGAVREVCELILKAQGKWGDILSRFTGKK
jgi:3-deoxy-D-manno-octulosonate 8-phosphate phosphatase (KDO 8-P phosphatase)